MHELNNNSTQIPRLPLPNKPTKTKTTYQTRRNINAMLTSKSAVEALPYLP